RQSSVTGKDRGRERRLSSLPLPPNRTGGSPASGSPVGGSPARGLTRLRMGLGQRVQPVRSEEGVGLTNSLLSRPVRARSACDQSRHTVRPTPSGRGSLPLA